MAQGAYRPVIFAQGNMWTRKDPRVPLPPRWRYRYGNFNAPQITEPAELEDMLPQFFENEETKEKTSLDPRLTPEALRDRGIDVQALVLVGVTKYEYFCKHQAVCARSSISSFACQWMSLQIFVQSCPRVQSQLLFLKRHNTATSSISRINEVDHLLLSRSKIGGRSSAPAEQGGYFAP